MIPASYLYPYLDLGQDRDARAKTSRVTQSLRGLAGSALAAAVLALAFAGLA